MLSAELTVCAVATPPAAGAVGILRLSGRDALDIARPLVAQVPLTPVPRHAYFTHFTDRRGEVLDEGLFLYFVGPRSFTGEDVVELQGHGSPELLSLLQRELLKDARLRMAEPGEFTRRAFLNGRMDLVKAEAVAALIAAESEAHLRAAAAQLAGPFSERIREIRNPLVALSADLEATLSFPEEAAEVELQVSARIEQNLLALEKVVQESRRGAPLQRLPQVALFGPSNAGKSTLFNRLLGEQRALVDDAPGTTRDAVEARWTLRDLPVRLFDTAGFRSSADRVEAMGMARARAVLAQSEVALLLLPPGATETEVASWKREAGETKVLVVRSKSDLGASPLGSLGVSGKTGEGVEALCEQVAEMLWGTDVAKASWWVSERQLESLSLSLEALQGAREALRAASLDVVAGEVSRSVLALGQITGEETSAEVLDAIFSRFCIGK